MTRVNGRAPGCDSKHRDTHDVRNAKHLGWWCVQCHRYYARYPFRRPSSR